VSLASAEDFRAESESRQVDYEVVVIGAGFSGLRTLHECRELGLSVHAFDDASDVGGTWHWNRYPGARTDSESWVYAYNFSEELKAEWTWKERFPTQPEVEEYLKHVADRFDMRKDITFNTKIVSAHFDDETTRWTFTTDGGETVTSRFFVSAAGLLTVLLDPPFPGRDRFEGECYDTARWPKDGVDFTGKRVAVIGAGASGVQVMPIAAHSAAQVTLFQRTPNYVMPARNHPLTDAQSNEIKANYTEIWDQARRQAFGFPMDPAGRTISDVTPEEIERILEAGWESGGFRFVFETFDDLMVSDECNAYATEFVRKKIRAIVKDPKTADILCPDYPLGAKRPPLGHFYYETFNRDNVDIVNVKDEAIEEITAKGIRTTKGEYEFDVIVLALGFDGVVGAMTHMDVRGRRGETINEKWAGAPETNLGICVEGFPNMFMILGPSTTAGNVPVVMDEVVKWIGRALRHMDERGYARMETTKEASDAWYKVSMDVLEQTVLTHVEVGQGIHSWMIGTNVSGEVRPLFYMGGAGNYFALINEIADRDFEGFVFAQR
jgi:cation diffusion facilitator CzcD-associated flavoprotein CzcO